MSIKSLVKQVLTEKENRRYHRLLSDKCVTYEEWVREQEEACWGLGALKTADKAGVCEGVPGETDCANVDGVKAGCAEDAAEFVVIFASNGNPAENALKNITYYFKVYPQVQLLYGDEDVMSDAVPEGDAGTVKERIGEVRGEGRYAPWFKPDWSPDLLDSHFYFGSVVAVRRELFEKCCRVCTNCSEESVQEQFFESVSVEECTAEQWSGKAVVKQVTDPKAYERWIYTCVGLAGGYQQGSSAIGHFPGILFHCSSEGEQRKFLEYTPFLQERRNGLLQEIREQAAGSEKVSVVIPSKDNPEILKKCIQGCLTQKGVSLEIIVVDNGSSPENRSAIETMLGNMRNASAGKTVGDCECNIVYVYEPMEFNFSKMCNMGAERATGTYLLFLNDDVELCRPECLEEMAALAGRDYTGAVGLKLYYPDSKRIQHAGITNLPMGPVHKLQFKDDNGCYYYSANRGCKNVLAVTAACLMVEKDKYLEAGGFSEELRVAFNDVDFCFRLYELGYHNVCVNDCYAYHHESLSRGADESREKLERLLGEREKLYGRHPQLEGVDPYYSVHLNRVGLDTSIRPIYETGANVMQQVKYPLPTQSLENYRQDNCLMLRVEDSRKGRLIGYGVVLGDNNACYEKNLLLKPEESSQDAREEAVKKAANDAAAETREMSMKDAPGQNHAKEIYAVRVEGQYRPDLAENLSDQKNVALCGFDLQVEAGAIPKGRYLVGMAARNRVTGLKLVNWSNRAVEL